MSRTLATLIVALVVLPASGLTQQAPADRSLDLTGRWSMALDMSMGPAEPLLELKQEGDRITGTYTGRYGSFELSGTIKARKLAFTFTMGTAADPIEVAFTGEVSADGESMKGEATLGTMGDATWSAKREKAK